MNVDLDINNYSLQDLLNLFNLNVDFSFEDLKNTKKIVLKTHPDKSKLPKEYFLFYSKAYKMLYHVFEFRSKTKKSFNDTYDNVVENSDETNKIIIKDMNNKEKFHSWFNRLFEKYYDKNDDGYGDWMNQNQIGDGKQQKMFQGEFNKDMFNHEFEKYKQEQQQKMGSQMVQYQEPESRLSMKNQDSLVTLGQGKVSNFSGETNGLGFTDYKAAFTIDSTLIDPRSVNLKGRSNSIGSIKQERSNISYELSSEDQQRLAYQEALQQKEERARLQRLQVYDQKGEDMYNRVHQMLLR